MKKIILLGSFVVFASCAKSSEDSRYSKQISVAKKELIKMKVRDFELEKYQFKVTEAFDKDVYKMVQKKYDENIKRDKSIGDLKSVGENYKIIENYLNLSINSTGKTFYKVQAYRIEEDTLNNKIVFIDNKNQVIDSHNIK